jgi:rhomboid family GlyGly-CTERM serine protease
MKPLRPALLLFALPACLSWFFPGTQTSLLYERTAILHGEWWRLWTGHWVHFSTSHLAWNLAVLLGTGAWLERLQPGWLLRFTLLAAPVLSLIMLLGEPALQAYGGLSGLATGAVVLLALTQLTREGEAGFWWWAVLALVAAKTGLDALRPDSLFVGFGAQAVRSSGLAHTGGAVAALVFFLSRQRWFCHPLSGALRPGPPTPSASR